MKCPKCSYGECKYIEQRRKNGSKNKIENKNKLERINFKARCKKCGWEGYI
jgi:hypothetical protein